MKDFLNNIKKDYWLLSLIIITFVACLVFTGHYNNIMIDIGREAYYPQRIIEGQVLYKDLFNIYGPFSYLFNALLFKMFGIHLSVLYVVGSLFAICFVAIIYKIGRIFLTELESFVVAFFSITVGVCAPIIFNFTFPYSFAMLYGTVFVTLSVYNLLKSLKSGDYRCGLYSLFFAGCAVANKYEFVPYLFVLLFFVIKSARKDILKWLGYACIFLLPLVISYGILFLQGLSVANLFETFDIVKTMSTTETLKYFYVNHGNFISLKAFVFDIITFLYVAVIIAFNYYSVKLYYSDKKFFGEVLCALAIGITICGAMFAKQNYFIYLPMLLIVLFLLNFRKNNDNLKNWLFASGILLSLKSFGALMVLSYGSYYISLLLIVLLNFVSKTLRQAVCMFLIVLSLLFAYNGIKNNPKLYLNTDKGRIYVSKTIGVKTLLDKVQNIAPEDKVVILPEGLMINFLANRKSEDFYNSFLPLYIETFGQERLINAYKISNPKYIVLGNLRMSDYGYNFLCQDYGFAFCNYVVENYNLVDNIAEGATRFLIYKKK